MIKSLRNIIKKLTSRPEMSNHNFRFCKDFGIDTDALESLLGDEDALHKAICRRAITGSELPTNWWLGENAGEIHAKAIINHPTLKYIPPAMYGQKAQDGAQGFFMVIKQLETNQHHNIYLPEIEAVTDLLDFHSYTARHTSWQS